MIRLEQLTRRVGSRTVVDHLDLEVPAGELLVLLGPSGCGKTTTLKMINRLLEPTSGKIRIDGRDVSTLPAAALRRSIGYVFQGIGLFPHFTVGRNIGIVGELLGWERATLGARVTELLDLVGLPAAEYRSRMPSELSGGQQQRVGVARALCARPKVMLLDEPFGALDPTTRERLQQEFAALQRALGVTAIFVTHDMTEALTLADRIAVMRDGKIARLGTPQALLRDPGEDEIGAFLSTPLRQAARVREILGTVGADGKDRG